MTDRFQLYIGIKDTIRFESILSRNDIAFFTHPDGPLSGDLCRYYCLKSDRERIDQLLIGESIPASYEDQVHMDFETGQKVYRNIAIIGFVFLIIIISAIWIRSVWFI